VHIATRIKREIGIIINIIPSINENNDRALEAREGIRISHWE